MELISDLFIHKLYDQEPQTMVELVHSAQSFMNVEDAIIAKKRKRAKRMEVDLPCHPEQGSHPMKSRTREKKDETTGMQIRLQEGVSITRP